MQSTSHSQLLKSRPPRTNIPQQAKHACVLISEPAHPPPRRPQHPTAQHRPQKHGSSALPVADCETFDSRRDTLNCRYLIQPADSRRLTGPSGARLAQQKLSKLRVWASVCVCTHKWSCRRACDCVGCPLIPAPAHAQCDPRTHACKSTAALLVRTV